MPSVAQVQNAIDPQGTGKILNIIKCTNVATGIDQYDVVGGTYHPGKRHRVNVANSRTAAQIVGDIQAVFARDA